MFFKFRDPLESHINIIGTISAVWKWKIGFAPNAMGYAIYHSPSGFYTENLQ